MNKLEYKTQTGIWDAPQIVSFDSLFDYTVDKVFDSSTYEKMLPILKEWKDNAQNHLEAVKENAESLVKYRPLYEARYSFSRRSEFLIFDQNPHIIHKIYKSAPNRGNHLAHTLRPLMAKLIESAILHKNLTHFSVPKEGLFPIATKEVISTLDEQDINQAFIVCAENKDFFDKNITIEKIKEMHQELQERIAEQACQIPLSTGLGDYTWENIRKDVYTDIFHILDTEPLFGELLINRFGDGYDWNKCIALNINPTLKSCAKSGLKEFKKSSETHNLEIFADTAQTHLEKFD